MDGFTLAMLALGALCGGFINGLAGFGTALFALGFFLQVMTPLEAVSTSAVLAIVTGLQGLWHLRAHILPNRDVIARFLLPALPGIPIGTALAARVDPTPLKLLVAMLLIAYAVFFYARASLAKTDTPTPVRDAMVGFAGGVLGGLASLSGALPTMWCSMKAWEKHRIRASLQVFNFATLSLSVMLFAYRGAYDSGRVLTIAGCLAVAVIGATLGIRIFSAIGTVTFKRVIITVCGLLGILLLGQSLFELASGA